DHQVHIEWPRRDSSDCTDHERPDGDVWHEMAVHHIDVNEIRAAAFDGDDLFPERREIGRQNRRCDLDRTVQRLTSSEMGSEAATRKPPCGCCRTTVSAGTPGYGCEPVIVARKPRLRSASATRAPSMPMTSGMT